MDIKHVLSLNPLQPGVRRHAAAPPPTPDPLGWVDVEGGLVEIGHEGDGFCFDNELPRHQQCLEPYRLADRLVTNGEWLEFMADGGYRAPRALALRRLGAGQRRGLAGAVLLDRGRRRLVRAHPARHAGRSTRACRSATSATTRPTPTPPGPASGCPPRPSGSTPSSPTGRPTPRPRGNLADTDDLPPAGRRAGDGRPAPGLRRLLGVDVARPTSPTPASTRRPARSASTTASSCPTRWCCAAAARSPRPATPARPTATSSRPGRGGRCPACASPTAGAAADEPHASRSSRSLLDPDWAAGALVDDVRRGLGSQPRTLPPKWLYDDVGSDLFDEITRLPEYYPTERERAILRDARRRHRRPRATRRRWSSSAAARATRPAPLLDAFTARRAASSASCRSTSPRRPCATPPSMLSERYPALRGRGARRRLHAAPRPPAARRPPARRVPRRHHRQPLRRGAGAPSSAPCRQPRAGRLVAARHRPGQERRPADRGLRRRRGRHRARSCTNCLRVLNRELGADFDIDAFSYVPFWDPRQERMDLRLRADMPQRVTIPGADLDVRPRARRGDPRRDLDEVPARAPARRARRGRLRRRAHVDRRRRRLRSPWPAATTEPTAMVQVRWRRQWSVGVDLVKCESDAKMLRPSARERWAVAT